MTETLTIRTACAEDFGAVDLLLRRSYPVLLKRDYAPSVMVTALPRIARANMRLLRSGSYYLVENDERQVLAAGGWSWRSPMGGPGAAGLGHIRHVVTDHRHTRRGIGAALMEHILETAGGEGVTKFDCLSTLTAEAFYTSLGFRRLGEVELSLAPGIRFPAVQMVRS